MTLHWTLHCSACDHAQPGGTPAGVCPRCGQGKLFGGFLTLAPRCRACGLDFSFADSADGPAVFVIFFLGVIVVGLAAWVELRFAPSIWVHMALWTPLIVGGAIAMLRPLKAALIALQYRHRILHPPPAA